MNLITQWHDDRENWREARILIRAKWLYREEQGEDWSDAKATEVQSAYLNRAERDLAAEGSIGRNYGAITVSIRSDVELVIDAARMVGEPIDADKLALRVYQHHPSSDLMQIRDMVLDLLDEQELESAVRSPWT